MGLPSTSCNCSYKKSQSNLGLKLKNTVTGEESSKDFTGLFVAIGHLPRSELVALKEWVSNGGSLIVLSEHAPIDKSMTPLLNTFGIQSSVGAIFDPVNCDTTIKLPLYETILKFTNSNGLLNRNHPITTGAKKKEVIQNIETYTGCALTGPNYTTILKLGSTATIKKWNGILPTGGGDSQCLAGTFGRGKLMAMGDCNGFTAMYVNSGGKRFNAGMQVEEYDWKQFVLNTIHWLSE